MKFTLEQYNSNIQDWYLDDFTVPSNDNFMFELFNLLPNRLQGTALSWSGSDSVFRGGGLQIFNSNLFSVNN